jgi:hypothetical protein
MEFPKEILMNNFLSALLVLGITVGMSAVRQKDDTSANKPKKMEAPATAPSDGSAESDSMAADAESDVRLIASKVSKLKRRYAGASASERPILYIQLAELDVQMAKAEANLRSWQPLPAGSGLELR